MDDAVDRLQRPLGIDGHGRDVVDVGFHDLGRAQPIQGANDEIGVAQPAEAIVPVALRAGGLGNRGCVGRDDRACLLEVAQLQCNGGPDDGELPFERDAETAHPVEPIVARALEKLARDRVDGGFERLVGAEDQRDGVRQRERCLVCDVGQRRIRREPQNVDTADEAHVVGADRLAVAGLAVVERRPQPDGDTRQSPHGLDAADDLRGVESALEALEARREVGNLDDVAVAVLEDRLHDRRIADVGRSGLARVVQDHVAEALLLLAGQEAREDGIGIKTRKTPPDDAPVGIDEGRHASVADCGELEVVGGGMASLLAHVASREGAWAGGDEQRAL